MKSDAVNFFVCKHTLSYITDRVNNRHNVRLGADEVYKMIQELKVQGKLPFDYVYDDWTNEYDPPNYVIAMMSRPAASSAHANGSTLPPHSSR